MYKIIQSGSKGNAVLYHNEILVDCGVSLKALKPYLKNIKMVLLTHRHSDHINMGTVSKIAAKHPSIKWFIASWMSEKVSKSIINKNSIIIVEMNHVYQLKDIIVSPFNLYHNVPNCGWRIITKNTKIFHATDTSALNGIEAKDYDLYAIEFNYDADTIGNIIEEKREQQVYSYEIDAIKNHMSWQDAQTWFNSQKGKNSQLVKLHVSHRYSQEEIDNWKL